MRCRILVVKDAHRLSCEAFPCHGCRVPTGREIFVEKFQNAPVDHLRLVKVQRMAGTGNEARFDIGYQVCGALQRRFGIINDLALSEQE